MQDGRALFAVDAEPLDAGALAPAELVSVRDIAPRLAQDDGGLIAYAAALLNWHRRHRFCSVCGEPEPRSRRRACCAAARTAAPSTTRAPIRS